ncbi:MAG: hypothetical protein FWG66_00065 [Spirochaetes bacterium]|nr:hypothetical protein [Spirochaetota bacterium]
MEKWREEIRKKLDEGGYIAVESAGVLTSKDVLAAIDEIDRLEAVRDENEEWGHIKTLQAGRENTAYDSIFNGYYDMWHNETKYLSSPKMFENKHYRNIISLGMNAVPGIIEKLKETPSHLFEALAEITGEDPVDETHWGDLEQMAQDWIKWWEKENRA